MLLSPEQIIQKLHAYRGWEYKDDAVSKTYRFADFMAVLDLVNKVAIIAEEAGHHPDILIQYNAVTFALTTHDEDGVTEKDIKLIREIERQAIMLV